MATAVPGIIWYFMVLHGIIVYHTIINSLSLEDAARRTLLQLLVRHNSLVVKFLFGVSRAKLQVPTTQLAKMSIDPKFVELTADVLEN